MTEFMRINILLKIRKLLFFHDVAFQKDVIEFS